MSVKLFTTLVLATSIFTVAPVYAAGSGSGGGSFGGGGGASPSVPSYDPVVEYQAGLKNIEAEKFINLRPAISNLPLSMMRICMQLTAVLVQPMPTEEK